MAQNAEAASGTSGKCTDFTRTSAYKQLRRDMLGDLNARGLVASQYTDKVLEYLRLWCWLQMLNEDIVARGVYVEYSNGATQKGTTDNKSISLATTVSRQMLAIWAALGFRDQATSLKPLSGADDDAL